MIDELAVEMVVNQGACIALTGDDKREAIRLLAAKGTMTWGEIARRLKCEKKAVEALAKRFGIVKEERPAWARKRYPQWEQQKTA